MGQDLGDRDKVNETMVRDRGSDEVVTDFNDLLYISEMGDGKNVAKMEVFESSTKSRHFKDVC